MVRAEGAILDLHAEVLHSSAVHLVRTLVLRLGLTDRPVLNRMAV
jgi:hypothetical protein